MLKFTFYSVFIILFVIGGALAMTGIVPFRPFYAALLPLLLIPIYGIRLDTITLRFILFTTIIILSAIVNGSSIPQVIQFFRFIIIPFSMYYLVRMYVTPRNIQKIIRLCIALGVIQLPVILLQRLLSEAMINFSAVGIDPLDINFGTFFVADDPALSLFLISMIIFLLFDTQNHQFVRRRTFLIAWFTLTVFLTNSMLSHIILIGIWGYYLIRRMSLRTAIRVGLVGLITVCLFLYFNYYDTYKRMLAPAVAQLTMRGVENENTFFEGGYARTTAMLYYLNQPLKVLGDGPSRYYNPVTREYFLGNKGQMFTFYSEIGIVGLLLGYWLLYSITRKKGSSPAVAGVYFVAVSALTITVSVMSDAGIMLAYNLFLSTDLISRQGVQRSGLPSTAHLSTA